MDLKGFLKYFSSDSRIKGGKLGLCILCQEKNLRLSHVVPKWAFKWGKAEGKLVGRYESLSVRVIHQDGSKSYLLCDEHEQKLGEAENYLKVLMHGTSQEKQKRRIIEKDEFFDNINYHFVRKAILGIALKSHYSNAAPFHKIKIEKINLDKIRNEILRPSEDDTIYPIVAMRFFSKKEPTIDPKAIIIPQHVTSPEGIDEFISFFFAGWEWFLFFRLNNDETLGKQLFDMRLQKEKPFNVPWGDILDNRLVNRKK